MENSTNKTIKTKDLTRAELYLREIMFLPDDDCVNLNPIDLDDH